MKSNYLLTELTSEFLTSDKDWRCSNLVYSAKERSLKSFDVLIACQQGVAGKWSWFDPNASDLEKLTSRQISYMMKQQTIVKQLITEHNNSHTKKKQQETKDMFGGKTLDQIVAEKLAEKRHGGYTGSAVGVGGNCGSLSAPSFATPEAPTADSILSGSLDRDVALLQSFKQFVAIIVREVMEENCYEN